MARRCVGNRFLSASTALNRFFRLLLIRGGWERHFGKLAISDALKGQQLGLLEFR